MYTNPESLMGTVIDGYQLVRILGTGSTSVVYEARAAAPAQVEQQSAGEPSQGDDQEGGRATTTAPARMAAVKVLMPRNLTASTDVREFTRRFQREARAASKLTHPHILPVLTYGEVDGQYYMIMPLIAMGTLATWLSTQSAPLPLGVVADILEQTADALDYAHRQGLIHRDIKPSNLLRDADGTIYLTDFGLARLVANHDSSLLLTEAANNATLTQTGETLGTPYYMAPEQIRGEPVGPTTDVYSLGVVLYLLVTGQVPFQGETSLTVALQHLQEEPCPPHLLRFDVPPGVEEVMLRALAKEPGDRYPSAGALAAAFARQVPRAGVDDPGDTVLALPAGAEHEEDTGDTRGKRSLVGQVLGKYTVDEVLAADDLGVLCRAHTAPDGVTYRLRVLAGAPTAQAPTDTSDEALGRMSERAQALVGLRHPGLLPLLDVGIAQGCLYAVSAAPSGNTLTRVLADRGPFEPGRADECLTQVATALDWAHGKGITHGALGAASIYVDGPDDEPPTVQVADLGLRQVRDQEAQGAQDARKASQDTPQERGRRLAPGGDAAPEVLQGQPAGPAADVYALGGVLFTLLTARPLFDGDMADEVAQQHLYSPVPSLRRVRPGLPSALQNILARALAKDPHQRYAHPGDLARAYHEVISRASLSSTQSGGTILAPVGSRVSAARSGWAGAGGSTVAAGQPPNVETTAARPAGSGSDGGETRIAALPDSVQTTANQSGSAPPATLAGRGSHPPGADVSTARGGHAGASILRPRWLALGAVTIIAIAALIFIAVRGLAPMSTATIAFGDNPHTQAGQSNLVTVTAHGLANPPSGTAYYAWILDQTTETSQILGKLSKAGNDYAVQFASTGSGPLGMIVGQDTTRIQITAEPDATVPVHWPRGEVVLTVSVPWQSFVHVGHLLVAFPDTPNKVGLLVGLRSQAQLLDAQALRLRDDANSGNTTAYACEAQSIIDIVEGSNGPSYAPLPANCAGAGVTDIGDGHGILGSEGYDAGASDHANLAATAPGATAATKSHAHGVETAVANIDDWANTADRAAWWDVHHPNDTSNVAALVAACTEVYAGHNPTGNGLAQPLAGQAGALTAYHEGQLMATLGLGQPAS